MLDFIEIIKVIFLGIVEGITEWLPISSTGHMLLVDEFIKMNVSARSGGGRLSFVEALFPRFCVGRIGLPVMPGEEGVSCTAPQNRS